MVKKSNLFMERLREMRVSLLICALLALITLAVFWRATGNGFLLLDDDEYVTENPVVQSGLNADTIRWALQTRRCSNWHPLTWVSHTVDYQLYGLEPFGHHLTNVLIHIANVLLLFLALSRMTRSPWKSAFVAALFAVHPLRVESVAWVAERKDVLSAFFWILTMWTYAYYVSKPVLARQLLVIAAFGLGLAAKPMLVTLPFVLLLLDYWPLRRLRLTRSQAKDPAVRFVDLLWEKLPLFALAAGSSIITYRAQQMGGAVALFGLLPVEIRAANAVVSYAAYLWKTIWPANLAAFYPHLVNQIPAWQVVGSIALLIVVTTLVIRAAGRRPYLAVGWLWYLVALIPTIGLVQVGGQAMADRYTYLPLIGIFIMAAWGMGEWVKGRKGEWVTGVVAAVVIAVLMISSWIHVGYWQDDFSVCRHGIEVTKDNYAMHLNLAVALSKQGDIEEATKEFEETIRIVPSTIQAHNNLAVIYYDTGRYAKAWKEVHECEKYGYRPRAELLEALSAAMPEPGK